MDDYSHGYVHELRKQLMGESDAQKIRCAEIESISEDSEGETYVSVCKPLPTYTVYNSKLVRSPTDIVPLLTSVPPIYQRH
jgi:hypothetical protein